MVRTVLLIVLLLAAITQQAFTPSSRSAAQPGLVQPQSAAPTGTEAAKPTGRKAAETEFARTIEQLSELGGYFDSDNLVSNEASYLHVLGKLRKMGVSGGAYIGVGPDQSFSYIAQIRPRVAFIVDIRRDNLLQHFLFKSLFALSRNRLEYLCLLFGKPAPDKALDWNQRSAQQLLDYLDRTPARKELFDSTRAAVQAKVKTFGLPLSVIDLETIGRIHLNFFHEGPDLRFTSRNRPPRPYYPTFRDLMLERDLAGRQGNYFASEDDFQFLKTMQEQNQIIPVVGNLAGEHALPSIARLLQERGERVSAFYTSNVEFYLMREGGFDRFAENVRLLPRDERSVIIRSYFSGAYGYSHPQAMPGYYSTQLLQTMESLVKEYASGGYQTYADVVNKHSLDLR
jgi:hypothetical protein